MAATHGTNGRFLIHDGVSLRDISNYLELASLKRAADTAESSGLGDAWKEFVKGLKEATLNSNGQYDATLDGYFALIDALDSTTWEYYPSGTTTGCVKYSGSCILTKWDEESKVDDKAICENEFQVTGAITRAVVA